MSLSNVDVSAALRRVAERRIEEAMAEGKFDNLPGAGKPIDLDPIPAEENARMMWWALRIMKKNDFTPEEVRWRKAIDHLRARLEAAPTEAEVSRLVAQVNGLVHKLNTLGTNAMNSAGMSPLDEARELANFRARTVK
jgi:hypothetical protein